MYKRALLGDAELSVKRNHYRYGLGVSVYVAHNSWDVAVNFILWTITITSYGEVEF